MHIDLDQLQDPLSPLRSDVCIIGAGVAGLILAQRLAESGIEVHLLEAGGLDFEERSQAFYNAEMADARHTGTMDGRFRTFGGSSTRWGGQLLPFTADIFTPPPGVPSLPWPIDERALTPYYKTIEQLMKVDPLPFTGDLLQSLGHPAVPLSPAIQLRYSKWAPFRQRNLGQTIGKVLLTHPRVHIYSHANVASLHAAQSGRVQYARVLNYTKTEFTFQSKHFIIAAGTIESSRLMLCSPAVPNVHDQIGRYFHDHVSLHAAVLEGASRQQVLDRFGPFLVDGTLHTCKLEASAATRDKAGLLAVMAHFVIQEPEDSGAAAIRNLLRSLQSGNLREAVGANLVPMLRGSSDVARMLWYMRVRKRRAVSSRAVVRMNIDMEQLASAATRIRLSTHLDSLGLPKAIVDWRIGHAECDTALAFAPIIRKSLESAGIEALTWTPKFLEGAVPEMADTYHAMGGLRMGTSPSSSVVDSNLQVHGLSNLYVASCASYPSGGSSNPTFTLMALAMRLADRLISQH